MREITVKSIWKRSGTAVNGRMGIPSSAAAAGMVQPGWDSLTAAAVGAMREGNVTGAKSAGSLY